MVVGGAFTTLGGQPRNRIGRLHANGSLDATFNPGAESLVAALAVQANGKMVVGGTFITLGGQPRNRIGRLHPDGSLDTTFNPGANGDVHTVAVQADGKVVIGGLFTTLGGQPRNRLGRLSSPTAALQDLQVDVSGKIMTWRRGGSSPEVRRAILEQSLDGVTWIGIGAAARVAEGWQRTSVSLPTGLLVYVRARGFASSGYRTGSESVYESVRVVFLPTDVTTSVSGFAVSAGTGSMVSGSVSYRNVGVATAHGVGYELTLRAGLSGVTVSCSNAVTASYGSGTGMVTFNGAPGLLSSGGGFSCTVSYRAPSGGQVPVASRVRTTTYQGRNQAPDSARVTTAIRPTVRINDVSQAEGNGGSPTAFTFTVTLSGAAVTAVTVKYATANGTPTTPADYTATSGTLTFSTGETSKTITVNVAGNTVVEPNEKFAVNLSRATGATIFDGQGAGNILNDDGPVLRITDVSRAEGNVGTTTAFTFTVPLSPASTSTVTVNYATANGSALAGNDYTAANGTLTFFAGQISKMVTIDVAGDTVVEPNEAFIVNLLSGATGATIFDSQGVGTILNDDRPVLRITNVSQAEGNAGTTAFTFTVTLSPASTGTVTVNYATANGTATPPADYTATSGTLTFSTGQTSKTVTVNVAGNTAVEPNEAFAVNLSLATGATIFDSQGVGTILNDD